MPSGKKRKRHKVATHKRKREQEQTDTKRNSVLGFTLNTPSSLT
ncbi:MAG: hypothetical protein CM15mP102_15050 [Flavobacteriales bacterium]|nr:MAG: hypothetical protein CM15mP102_15050 [Flavobacteriales bacterium]